MKNPNSALITRAIEFARARHAGQKDDTGADYFLAHVWNVGRIVEMVTADSEIIASAYLHDTLEDTKTTFQELKIRFGARVARLVRELTKEGTDDEIGYYFPNLKSRDAILIKFADRLSNISRMEAWSPKRQAHYLAKSKFWRSEGK